MSQTPPDSPSSNTPGSAPTGPKKKPRRVDKLLGTHLDGKYQILKKIGEGGMGSVYIANQEPIDRKVAVKVLLSKLAEDEIAVKRFEQEARAISKMQHPNTVTIYDFGRVEDHEEDTERLFIVMEYLKGFTLTQVLRQEGAIPGPRASRILRQVCASLADAHGAGIIHRDLKPDNIFLSEIGGEKDWVKVLDFGVAKLADSESAGTLTQTGMIFGTPKYMSPEQAEGKPIDYRADIYALGVVLYELLTGKPPFVSDTPVGLLLKHISEPPRPFREAAADRDVDPRLEQVVMRALEKHPDRRQQQVTELAAELEQYERAVTGPQLIPTDVGRLSSTVGTGPVPLGLPTEVVPGTYPGHAVTPSNLAPPDRVPPDLSRGVPGSHPSIGTAAGTLASGTGQGTAQATLATAPGLTAPMGATGHDTLGSGLGGEFSGSLPRQRRTPLPYVIGAATALLVGGLVVAQLFRGSTPIVEAVEPIKVQPGIDAPSLPPAIAGTPGEEVEPARVTDSSPAESAIDEGRQGGPSDPALTQSDGRGKQLRSPRLHRPGISDRALKVAIQLTSEPPGATVSLKGRQVGVTPVEIELPKSEDLLTFVFEKKGFQKKRQIATSARDGIIEVVLTKRTRPSKIRRRCPDGTRPPCQAKKVNPLDLKVDDLK